MQTFEPLSFVRSLARESLDAVRPEVDKRYQALAPRPDAQAADAVDAIADRTEKLVWTRVNRSLAGLGLVESLAGHLRAGTSIKHAEHEPMLAEAARLLRAARLAGAANQTRVDSLANELEALATEGKAYAAVIVAELKKLCTMGDLAVRNQRLGWLHRCAQAGPDAGLDDMIRTAEKSVAAAKLEFQKAKLEEKEVKAS